MRYNSTTEQNNIKVKIKPDKEQVAIRLKEIRKKLNLSIAEFGERIGVPKATVNSWIRGLALPPKEKVHRIALIANTTSNWILWGSESSENCSLCSLALSEGECLNCLNRKQVEIMNFFAMVNSELFPMNEERKLLILKITSFELEEIKAKIEKI